MIDGDQLARWLTQRQEAVKPAIAKAIYEGLRMRVARGDFDAPTDEGSRDD